MIEQTVDIATRDGAITTFIVHPDRGGPHPVIVFLMDAPAIREELRDMTRRLASVGYCVLLPNLYYRSNVLELPAEYMADPEYKAMFALMNSINIPMVMEDTDALLAAVGAAWALDIAPDLIVHFGALSWRGRRPRGDPAIIAGTPQERRPRRSTAVSQADVRPWPSSRSRSCA